MSHPRVTVIVRSYKRRVALLELLHRLGGQTYSDFEIVICDQSDDPQLVRDVEAIADPRIRLVVREPLGAPGARNETIRHARGGILIMIDDDDLPVGDDWIVRHVTNYEDPLCQGVAGRCVPSDEQALQPHVTERARRRVLSLTFFKDGRWLAWLSERKVGIDYLFGTNASFRRSLVDRIGGWDEVPGLMWGEEQSFSIKFQKERRDGEYFVFDPTPAAVRRTDIEGGCARRTGTGWVDRELSSRILYFHRIVAFYYPLRFWLLYPVFLTWIFLRFVGWVWDSDNRHMGVAPRVVACVKSALIFPWLLARHGWLRPKGTTRRVRSLPWPEGAVRG